jgi:hypothetical protein
MGNLLRILLVLTSFSTVQTRAQMDPESRRLIQFGFNQPVEGHSPISGYGFYYHNQPGFPSTNTTLRLAVAPIYLDSELGFSRLLGPNTDVAVGLAGGGFAHTYSEIRGGKYFTEESFIGHGGEVSSSLYHRFNPDHEIPLWLVVRGSAHRFMYEREDRTAANFQIADDFTSFRVRTGLRFGGQEPSLTAPLAMELSVWHETQFRLETGPYGYAGDRLVEPNSHLFWARALCKLTFENEHLVDASLTAGTSVNADRFDAYRLGGMLPFVSEFPLNIPGYYFQEISASRFVLLNAQYSFPLTPNRNWRLAFYGATGGVDYLGGLEQPGRWHSGVGGGVSYISPTGAWMASVIYGHGIDAIRSDGRSANQVGFILQYDFDAKPHGRSRFFMPGVSPYRSRGGEQLFR